ncbi:MAG: thiolase domain-containing protein [Anaerolineales bacterium]|jgi:acetyl-CoA C-acetyltransferase
MREVAVLGVGQTPISEHWDRSIRDLAGEAIFAAVQDANCTSVDALFVANMLSGSLSHQENLGALIADWVGFRHVEAVKVEAACASGGAALRAAMTAISSGELECVVVAGVEKMTDAKPREVTAALATAADADYESAHGLSFVALNALIMQRYMHQYGWQHADFAPFSINAHANAVHNPFARLPFTISASEYKNARMIADPINLLDASPIGDGAAALVLVPAALLPISQPGARPSVSIIGSASATDALALHDRKNLLWLSAAEASARRAYAQAVLGPQDIDFFELHDAFSIMSVLSLEACGFAECGQGPRLGLDGDILPTGRIPITTLGGLKARGHPVGATGVYQVVEVVQQLRHEAGQNQIDGAHVGMAQSIGGSGATIVTHILKRN